MKGFFRKLDKIDAIVERGSSLESASALVAMMTETASTVYALNAIDASWLKPLDSLGFFRGELAETEDVNGPRRATWPASAYLKRVAENAKDEETAQTLQRILSFLPLPDNFYVVRDMIDIAVSLPNEMRRVVVPVIQRVLSRANTVEFTNITALINTLAQNGDTGAALRLFSVLFAVFPPETHEQPLFASIPRAFLEPWYYRREMNNCVSSLTRLGGLRVLNCLCRILDQFLRISTKQPRFQGPDDYSYIWRPAIEDHEQNVHEDQRDTLVTAIRDCALTLLSESPSLFVDLMEILDSQQWFVFTRILLFVLADSPAATQDAIAKYSTDPYLFSEIGVRHEYSRLLQKRFRGLTNEQQDAILIIIESGPEKSTFQRHVVRAFDREATESELLAYVRRWQFDWLSFIKDDLPDHWKIRFIDLKKEFVEPEHPDFPVFTSSGLGLGPGGPRVPPDAADTVTVEALLDKISAHVNRTEPLNDEIRDMAERLGNLSEEDRKAIERSANEIVLLPPTAIDTLVSKLVTPIADGTEPSAGPLLQLLQGISQRIPKVEDTEVRASLLELTSRIVSHFVPDRQELIRDELVPMLVEIMQRLLTVLRADRHPARRQFSQELEPLTAAINTPSGRILDSAVKLAVFERKNQGSAVLEPHWLLDALSHLLLTLPNDERLISAILGYRFPWLVYLFSRWASDHAEMIFPTSPGLRRRWEAAWFSYVSYAGAYDNVFAVLGDQYAKAVEDLSREREYKRSDANPITGLAQHLALFYWRGQMTVRDPLLLRFAKLGNESAVSTLLSTLGRGIREGIDIPHDRIKSLRELAEWTTLKWRPRHKKVQKALSAFGWWFPHDSLGDEIWRLKILQRAVAKAGSVQNPDQVFKILEEMASEMPDGVVSCLRSLVIGTSDESTRYFLASRAKAILEKADVSASQLTRNKIGEIADHFGAIGHFEYRHLAHVT